MPLAESEKTVAVPEKKPVSKAPVAPPTPVKRADKTGLTSEQRAVWNEATLANPDLGQIKTPTLVQYNELLDRMYNNYHQSFRDVISRDEFGSAPMAFFASPEARQLYKLKDRQPMGPSVQGGSPLFGVPPGMTVQDMQNSEMAATMQMATTGQLSQIPGLGPNGALPEIAGSQKVDQSLVPYMQPTAGQAQFGQPLPPAEVTEGIPEGYKGGKVGPHGEPLPPGATAYTPLGTVWYGDGGTWREQGAAAVTKDLWGYVKDAAKNWWAAVRGDATTNEQWFTNLVVGEGDYVSGTEIASKIELAPARFVWTMSPEERDIALSQNIQNISSAFELLGAGAHNLQQLPLGIGALSRVVGASLGVVFKVLNFGAPVKRVVGTAQGMIRGYDLDEAWLASRMAATNLFNTKAQDEYVDRYRSGENPVLLALELEDPIKETITEAILDPTLILLPVVKAATGLDWFATACRTFNKLLQAENAASTAHSIGLAARVAEGVINTEEAATDLVTTIKLAKTVEAADKSVTGLQRATGLRAYLSSAKAAIAQANLDTWWQVVHKMFDKNMEGTTKFIGMMAQYANTVNDEEKIRIATGLIELGRTHGVELAPMISLMKSQGGHEASKLMAWVLENSSGEVLEGGRLGKILERAQQLDRMTPDEIAAEVAKVNELNKKTGLVIKDPDKLALLLNDESTRAVNKVMDDMFPSILDRARKQVEIAGRLEELGGDPANLPAKLLPFVGDVIKPRTIKAARINEALKKVYGPINGFFSQVYLGWNTAFAARNGMTNAVMVAIEGGPSALFGRPAAYGKMYTDIFGSVPSKAKAGFGQIGALIVNKWEAEDAGRATAWWKKGLAQKWSEALESNQGMQIHGKVFVREMRKSTNALFTSIRQPLLEAGAAPKDVARLEELIRENGYSFNKGIKAFFSEAPETRRTLGHLKPEDLEALEEFPGARDRILDLLRTSSNQEDWDNGMADIIRRAQADADSVEFEIPHLSDAHPDYDEIVEEIGDAVEDGTSPTNMDIVEAKIQANFAATESSQHAMSQVDTLATKKIEAMASRGMLKPEEASKLRVTIAEARERVDKTIAQLTKERSAAHADLRAKALAARNAAMKKGDSVEVERIWTKYFKDRDALHREARIAIHEEVTKFVESSEIKGLELDLASWDTAIQKELMASSIDEMDPVAYIVRGRIVPKRNPELFGMLDDAGVTTRVEGMNGTRLRSWKSIVGSINKSESFPSDIKPFSVEELQAFHRMKPERKQEFAKALAAIAEGEVPDTGDAEGVVRLLAAKKDEALDIADRLVIEATDAEAVRTTLREAPEEVRSVLKSIENVEIGSGGRVQIQITVGKGLAEAKRPTATGLSGKIVYPIRLSPYRLSDPKLLREDLIHELGHLATNIWHGHAGPDATPTQRAFWEAMMPRMETAFANGKGRIGQIGTTYSDADRPWENLANGVIKLLTDPEALDDDQFEVITDILDNSPGFRGLLERADGLGRGALSGEAMDWFVKTDPAALDKMPMTDELRRIAGMNGLDPQEPGLSAKTVYEAMQRKIGRKIPGTSTNMIQRGRQTAHLHLGATVPPKVASSKLNLASMTAEEVASKADEIAQTVAQDLQQMLKDRVPGGVTGRKLTVAGDGSIRLQLDISVPNTTDVDSVLADAAKYLDSSDDFDGLEIIEDFDDLEFSGTPEDLSKAFMRPLGSDAGVESWDVSLRTDFDVPLAPDEAENVAQYLEARGIPTRVSSDGKSLEVMNVAERYGKPGFVQEEIDDVLDELGLAGRRTEEVRPVVIRRSRIAKTTEATNLDGTSAASFVLYTEVGAGASRRIPGVSYSTTGELERLVVSDTAVAAAKKSAPHKLTAAAVGTKGGVLQVRDSSYTMQDGVKVFNISRKDRQVLHVESKQALQVLRPDQKSVVLYVPVDDSPGSVGRLGGDVFLGRLSEVPPKAGVQMQAVEVPVESILTGSEWNPLLRGSGDESGHFMMVDLRAVRTSEDPSAGVHLMTTLDPSVSPRIVVAEMNASKAAAAADAPKIIVPHSDAEVGQKVVNMRITQPSGAPVRGTPISIDDARIPDTVYHVTTNGDAVKGSGYLRAGGAGGLGGDNADQIVSLTVSKEVAVQLEKDMKGYSEVVRKFLPSEPAVGSPEHVRWADEVVAALNERLSPKGYVFELDEYQKQKFGMHDIQMAYFSSRDITGKVKNPVFFTRPDEMLKIDPAQIGVVSIPKRNLRTGAMVTDLDLSNPVGLQEIRVYGDVPLVTAAKTPPSKGVLVDDLVSLHAGIGASPKSRQAFMEMWDRAAAEYEKGRVLQAVGGDATERGKAISDLAVSGLVGDTEQQELLMAIAKKYNIKKDSPSEVARLILEQTWSPQSKDAEWWTQRFLTEIDNSPALLDEMVAHGMTREELADAMYREAYSGGELAGGRAGPFHMPDTRSQADIDGFLNKVTPRVKEDMSIGPKAAYRYRSADPDAEAKLSTFYRLGGQDPSPAQAAAENNQGLMDLLNRVKTDTGYEYFGEYPTAAPGKWAARTEAALRAWSAQGSLHMQDALIDSLGKADAVRDFALLDYQGGKRGIDALLGFVYPYQYWYSRTYTNWAKRALQKPWLITGYAHYRRYMETKNAGMPDWWKYNVKISTPFSDSPLYFNLESSLNPLNGLTGIDFDDERRRRSGMAQWVDQAGKFGPSVWTPIQWAVALNEAARGDMEAAGAWASRMFPQTQLIKGISGQLGIGGPGGLELDPLVWLQSGKVGSGETIYEQRRVVRALASLVQTGTLSEAQAIDVARNQSGPYWDMARDLALKQRQGGYILGGLLGVGFKARTIEDVQIDSAYSNLYALRAQRANMSPSEYRQGWQALLERYPFLDVLLLGRRTSEAERNESFAWNVMSRIPPGQSGYYSELVGIDEDLLSKFYDDKGSIYGSDDGRIKPWDEADRTAFISAMATIGALLDIPPMTLRHEWSEAKALYANISPTILSQMTGATDPDMLKEMQDQMDLMVDTYFALQAEDPEKARAWIKGFPAVQVYLDGKEKIIMGSPELFKYYGGIDFVERTWRGQMYAAAEEKYGSDIFMLQAAYFEIDAQGGDTRSFLAQYPKLRDYWQWLRGEKAKIGKMLEDVGRYIPADPKAITRPDAVAEGVLTSKMLAELQSFNPDVERDAIVSQYTKYEDVENEDFSLSNYIDTEAERTWPGVLAKDQEWRRLIAENPLMAKAYFAANSDLQQFDKWSKELRKQYNAQVAKPQARTPTQMAQQMDWSQWSELLSSGGADYVSRLTVDSFRSGTMSDALRQRLRSVWVSIGRPMGSFDAWVAEMKKDWKAGGSLY